VINNHIEQALSHGTKSFPALPAGPRSQRMQSEVYYIAADAAARRLWQTAGRTVYDIDPDLWAELGETKDDQLVPAALMRALPHPDPFVALPTPLTLPMDDDFFMRLEGFFVSGRAWIFDADTGEVKGQTVVSTHAPNANGNLGVTFGATVYQHSTGLPFRIDATFNDMVWSRVTLDVGMGSTPTVKELVDAVAPRFRNADESGRYDQTIPAMIRSAIAALIYLCATNVDLRPLPARPAERRKAKGAGAKPKPVKVYQVGFHLGAGLRAYRRQEAEQRAANPTGRTVRPHMRRAHLHLYWTGPGRTVPKVKLLEPIPINMNAPDDGLPTVQPIKKAKN
jgi:hypothetical protein